MMSRNARRIARVSSILVLSSALPTVAAAADEALELGKKVFVELATPQCSICHRLADAEAAGTIAPSLDDLKPTEDQVSEAVKTGPGVMPAYADLLTDEQIGAVAHYVATVARRDSE
jgi:mono/diheme cytochrome c family protein